MEGGVHIFNLSQVSEMEAQFKICFAGGKGAEEAATSFANAIDKEYLVSLAPFLPQIQAGLTNKKDTHAKVCRVVLTGSSITSPGWSVPCAGSFAQGGWFRSRALYNPFPRNSSGSLCRQTPTCDQGCKGNVHRSGSRFMQCLDQAGCPDRSQGAGADKSLADQVGGP